MTDGSSEPPGRIATREQKDNIYPCSVSIDQGAQGCYFPCCSLILSVYKTPKTRREREGSTGEPIRTILKYQCQYDTGLKNRKTKNLKYLQLYKGWGQFVPAGPGAAAASSGVFLGKLWAHGEGTSRAHWQLTEK